MAGPWLYCIAAAARRYFDLKDGPEDVNITSYKILVEAERIQEDPWWGISQNWKNVKPRDELFIYCGDKDQGIIGFAIIQEVKRRPDGWSLRLEFALDKCKALVGNPIPASVVRRWGLNLRRNVVNLSSIASDLDHHLPWTPDPLIKRRHLLEDAYIRFTPAQRRQIERRHNCLSNQFRKWLSKIGATAISAEAQSVDVSYEYARDSCLFELKTCYEQSTRHALREALGQVLEYAFYPGRTRPQHLAVVLDRKPAETDINWLGRLRAIGLAIELFWLDGETVYSTRLANNPLARHAQDSSAGA